MGSREVRGENTGEEFMWRKIVREGDVYCKLGIIIFEVGGILTVIFRVQRREKNNWKGKEYIYPSD